MGLKEVWSILFCMYEFNQILLVYHESWIRSLSLTPISGIHSTYSDSDSNSDSVSDSDSDSDRDSQLGTHKSVTNRLALICKKLPN